MQWVRSHKYKGAGSQRTSLSPIPALTPPFSSQGFRCQPLHAPTCTLPAPPHPCHPVSTSRPKLSIGTLLLSLLGLAQNMSCLPPVQRTESELPSQAQQGNFLSIVHTSPQKQLVGVYTGRNFLESHLATCTRSLKNSYLKKKTHTFFDSGISPLIIILRK